MWKPSWKQQQTSRVEITNCTYVLLSSVGHWATKGATFYARGYYTITQYMYDYYRDNNNNRFCFNFFPPRHCIVFCPCSLINFFAERQSLGSPKTNFIRKLIINLTVLFYSCRLLNLVCQYLSLDSVYRYHFESKSSISDDFIIILFRKVL